MRGNSKMGRRSRGVVSDFGQTLRMRKKKVREGVGRCKALSAAQQLEKIGSRWLNGEGALQGG